MYQKKLLLPVILLGFAFTLADKPVRKTFRYAKTVEVASVNEKDKLNGKFERTFDGKLVESGSYANGQKTGVWISKTVNGQVIKQLTYKNGQIDGVIKVVYPDGSPRVEGSFKDGLKTGKWTFYNSKRLIVRQGNYNEKGEPIDIWTFFDDDGRAVIEKYDFAAKKALIDNRGNLKYDNDNELKVRNLYMDKNIRVREVIDVPIAGARVLGGARKTKMFFNSNFEIPQDCWYTYISNSYFTTLSLSKSGALSNVQVNRSKEDKGTYKGDMDFYFFTEYENKLQRVPVEDRTLDHLADKISEDFQIYYGPWIVTSEKDLTGEIHMTVVVNQ